MPQLLLFSYLCQSRIKNWIATLASDYFEYVLYITSGHNGLALIDEYFTFIYFPAHRDWADFAALSRAIARYGIQSVRTAGSLIFPQDKEYRRLILMKRHSFRMIDCRMHSGRQARATFIAALSLRKLSLILFIFIHISYCLVNSFLLTTISRINTCADFLWPGWPRD